MITKVVQVEWRIKHSTLIFSLHLIEFDRLLNCVEMRKLVLFLLILSLLQPLAKAQQIEAALRNYLADCGADVGVALIVDDKDTITIGEGRFQLNSVMKLFQAIAIAEASDIKPDSMLVMDKECLDADTWSPMRDEADGTELHLTIEDLLRWSLVYSDNNACDILSEIVMPLEHVDSLLRNKGYSDFAIRWTEKDQHLEPLRANDNWATPLTAARIINDTYRRYEHSTHRLQTAVAKFLSQCTTGENRLPRPLKGTNHVIAHKTGTGFSDSDGRPQGINDVGFLSLSNGHFCSIAVFIRSSLHDTKTTESIIGDISAIVVNYLSLREEQ